MGVQVYVWKPSYYRELYDGLLGETEEIIELGFNVPKWKKDILLLLLKKANEPCPTNNKAYRKEIWKRIGNMKRKRYGCRFFQLEKIVGYHWFADRFPRKQLNCDML